MARYIDGMFINKKGDWECCHCHSTAPMYESVLHHPDCPTAQTTATSGEKMITFTIFETPNDQFDVTAPVDVPQNWDDMTEDDQRAYLIKPTGSRMHPGQILHNSSRFQLATGVQGEIWDFQFK